MKWNIGDVVKDEYGNIGRVGIIWNDGDICYFENDAAHPNPSKFNIKSIKSKYNILKPLKLGVLHLVHLLKFITLILVYKKEKFR